MGKTIYNAETGKTINLPEIKTYLIEMVSGNEFTLELDKQEYSDLLYCKRNGSLFEHGNVLINTLHIERILKGEK